MKTMTIERNGITFTIQATQQEIDLNQHITLIANVLNVQVTPRPKEPTIITDPARLLPDNFHSESIQEVIARAQKDPPLSLYDVAKKLGVHYNTIHKYCRFGLIEVEGDQRFGGWYIKKSEFERIKSNPNWLKEFQEVIKNKPYPSEEDIFYKKRLEILQEIEDLHKYREPLNPSYAIKHYKGLYQRARRFFGSWYNAIERTGIHYSQVYKKWNTSSAFRGRQKMSDEEMQLRGEMLLSKIKNLIKEGQLDYKTRRKLDCLIHSYQLGGWRSIYESLGLKYVEMKLGKVYTRRTKENIIADIRNLYNQGVSLKYINMVKNHCALLGAARQKFGNWPNAIKEAGLDYSKIRIRNRHIGTGRKNVQSEPLFVSRETAGVLV